MTTTPPSPESDEGPNHAAWEQFAAVMESLADTMDDGPMVTNEQGVEFLDALARRGYEVRPHASPTLASAIALGLAWQRASAAAEAHYNVGTHRGIVRLVGPMPPDPMFKPEVAERLRYSAECGHDLHHAPTPEAALIALAEALEARRG